MAHHKIFRLRVPAQNRPEIGQRHSLRSRLSEPIDHIDRSTDASGETYSLTFRNPENPKDGNYERMAFVVRRHGIFVNRGESGALLKRGKDWNASSVFRAVGVNEAKTLSRNLRSLLKEIVDWHPGSSWNQEHPQARMQEHIEFFAAQLDAFTNREAIPLHAGRSRQQNVGDFLSGQMRKT
jgi:hypothetical protein